MRRRAKVYLDTSVVSALYDEVNPERRSLTEEFFETIPNYEPFVSEVTVAEIARTPDPALKRKLEGAVAGLTVLPLTDEAESLAKEFIHAGAVPESHPEDAFHIAIAVLNDMDFLLSWNFRHIVRRRTRDIVAMVGSSRMLKRVELITPPELL